MNRSLGARLLASIVALLIVAAIGACKTVDDIGSAASSALEGTNDCKPSCTFMNCGDDGCGGSCGSCSWGQQCQGGQCQCVPDCGSHRCGDDGCGGSCGSCGPHEECDHGSCACVHSCAGIQCGSDGCGGDCGSCGSGLDCEFGTCVCHPYCGSATCGSDGCGGSCGECGDWEVCSGGRCHAGPPPPPPVCTHRLSEMGVPLHSECSACVAKVCQGKPSCCALRWDSSCIGAADAICPGHG